MSKQMSLEEGSDPGAMVLSRRWDALAAFFIGLYPSCDPPACCFDACVFPCYCLSVVDDHLTIFDDVLPDMRRDVQEIFRATPHHKQVMMFSATLAKEIRITCKKFMANVGLIIFTISFQLTSFDLLASGNFC